MTTDPLSTRSVGRERLLHPEFYGYCEGCRALVRHAAGRTVGDIVEVRCEPSSHWRGNYRLSLITGDMEGPLNVRS